jgi:exopolyphosphatase/guanosine-5'-triphosphate,3'-diphosphate pyrophosphatase
LSVNRLIGLSQREQLIIANLIRYHRMQSSNEEESFRSLPQKDRLIVIKLAALLRLSDSLDISHTENVTDVTLRETKSGWRMKVSSKKEQMLCVAFNKRKSHFREVFGVDLEMDE